MDEQLNSPDNLGEKKAILSCQLPLKFQLKIG